MIALTLIRKSVIKGKGSLHIPTTVSCVTKGMMSHTQSYSKPNIHQSNISLELLLRQSVIRRAALYVDILL